jgi:hypothetical protein
MGHGGANSPGKGHGPGKGLGIGNGGANGPGMAHGPGKSPGMAHGAGRGGTHGSFRQLEPPLLAKAQSLGVQLFRPYVVSSVLGSGEVLRGRVNEVLLLLNRWDQANKRVDFSVGSISLMAELLILATGAGAAQSAWRWLGIVLKI